MFNFVKKDSQEKLMSELAEIQAAPIYLLGKKAFISILCIAFLWNRIPKDMTQVWAKIELIDLYKDDPVLLKFIDLIGVEGRVDLGDITSAKLKDSNSFIPKTLDSISDTFKASEG